MTCSSLAVSLLAVSLLAVSASVLGCGPGITPAPAAGANTDDAREAAPHPSEPAPPTAFAAGTGDCVERPDNGDQYVIGLTATDREATFCVADDGDRQCLRVDLASGSYRRLEADPPSSRPPAPRVGAAGEVTLCNAAGKCAHVVSARAAALASADAESEVYGVLSADRALAAVVTGSEREDALPELELFDVASGRRIASRAIGSEGSEICPEHVQILGDAVYASLSVCAGPGASA